MYKVCQSNRLENLADQIARELSRPVAAPLAPETVIVDGVAMGQWLAVEIARRNGVCSNVRFVPPSRFVRDCAGAVLGDQEDEQPFSADVLAWRILGRLRPAAERSGSAALKAYIEAALDRDLYRLAQRVATLFVQYAQHRPDWLGSWEDEIKRWLGPDESWQAALWRALIARRARSDPIRRLGALRKALGARHARFQLPQRVMLVSVTSMSSPDQELLSELGSYINLTHYMWTPCRHVAAAGDHGSAQCNRILVSFGKRHLQLAETTLGYANILSNAGFVDPGTDSLLHTLQSDLLNGFDRTERSAITLRSDDLSVQVHACHSPMRELEVLHDQLLAMFDRDPALEPSDVLVLMTKPDTYVPLVDTVFHPRQGMPHIPYSIVDRPSTQRDPLVSAFLSILELAGSRFQVDRVLEPLECPAVLRRFGLDADSIPLIERWLRESGVRWGKDATHKAAFDLPAIQHHTWRFGLDRMLLGFALPSDDSGSVSPLFSGILPYDDIEGGMGDRLGRFATYYEALCQVVGGLDGEKPPPAWVAALRELFESMFLPAEAEEPSAQIVRNCIDRLDSDTRLAEFATPLPLDLIRAWLQDRLIESSRRGPFPTGKVTFAGIDTAFPAPARLICLIGLNDDAFPRRPAGLSFDLMRQSPRPTDPSARDEDRWSFLQTICAARESLYLSYVGADIRDNTERPPSVLLAALLDYIRAAFRTEDGRNVLDRIVTRHPLQAFNPDYFKGDPKLVSYSGALCAASRAAGAKRQPSLPLFASPLPEPEAELRPVDLDDLISFYRNPARYLLRRRLGIRLPYSPQVLEAREPFDLDYFQEQDLLASLLGERLGGSGAGDLFERTAAAGRLPHGSLGEATYARAREVVEAFAPSVERLAPSSEHPPIPIQFCAHGVQLTGLLRGVSGNGLFGYQADDIRPHHRLALWIRHLVLCHLRPKNVRRSARWVGLDRKTGPRMVTFDAVADPESLLADLLELYWSGLRAPLPFFVKSSYAYVEAGRNGKDALAAARRRWEVPDYRGAEQRGECENPYYLLTYRDTDPLDAEFESVAMRILSPLFEHQSEEVT